MKLVTTACVVLIKIYNYSGTSKESCAIRSLVSDSYIQSIVSTDKLKYILSEVSIDKLHDCI